MSATITWKIDELTRHVSDGFVTLATATVTCFKGTGVEKVEVETKCTTNFMKPDTLAPFTDLTEEQVIGWIKAEIGSEAVTALENNLKTQLDKKLEQTGKPW